MKKIVVQSRYSRQFFREVTGESVYALIKRLKMEQSAIALKVEKEKIEQKFRSQSLIYLLYILIDSFQD